MSMTFEELEKEVRQLSAEEKVTLARILIEDLDSSADEGVEHLWIEEAQRRYDAFRRGDGEAKSGEEVMRRARKRFS